LGMFDEVEPPAMLLRMSLMMESVFYLYVFMNSLPTFSRLSAWMR
jgi:hypothetical protein